VVRRTSDKLKLIKKPISPAMMNVKTVAARCIHAPGYA